MRGRKEESCFIITCNKLLKKTGIFPVSQRRPKEAKCWLMFIMPLSGFFSV